MVEFVWLLLGFVSRLRDMAKFPKVGDKIHVGKFFVSKMNVRAEEEFGISEKDEALQAHLSTAEIVQPFIARPENKEGHWKRDMDLSLAVGYGVIVGRRRFMAKRDRVTHFVVGKEVIIQELADEEALDASLKENLGIFRRDLDPITRGDKLKELVGRSTRSLRGWARRWNISPSTLSDWIRVTNTSPKLRKAIRRGIIPFWDGLKVVGLKLGTELQEKLGELALSEGLEAFRKELACLTAGKGKRGVPRDVYIIVRSTFDKRSPTDLESYKKLEKLAEERKMKVADYAKQVLVEHIKHIA